LQIFTDQLRDRFGPIPRIVRELFEGLRLRWICKEMGFDRVVLKNNKLILFFIQNPQSAFYETPYFTQFLALIASDGNDLGIKIKQSRSNLLVIQENVQSLKAAHWTLEKLQKTLGNTTHAKSEIQSA